MANMPPFLRRHTALRPLHVVVLVILVGYVTALGPARAGTYNPVLSIGDTAPEWKQLPGTDGEAHSWHDVKDKKLVVVVFTCNSCPYAVDHEERLIQLTYDYQGKSVAIVAINVNKIDADNLPAMKQRADERSFPFDYVFDETQQIARDFGAGNTPEFFLLDASRRVMYMGSMDDSPDGSQVSKTYLRDAIDAALSDKEIAVKETVPIGCRIRFQRR